jgi:hypothetical protein
VGPSAHAIPAEVAASASIYLSTTGDGVILSEEITTVQKEIASDVCIVKKAISASLSVDATYFFSISTRTIDKQKKYQFIISTKHIIFLICTVDWRGRRRLQGD